MNKKLPLYSVVILLMLSIVITFNTTYLMINEKHNRELNDTLSEYGMLDKLLAIDEVVRQNYIGDIDDEELMAAISQLKKAILYAAGNVSVGAICGHLMWALR